MRRFATAKLNESQSKDLSDILSTLIGYVYINCYIKNNQAKREGGHTLLLTFSFSLKMTQSQFLGFFSFLEI